MPNKLVSFSYLNQIDVPDVSADCVTSGGVGVMSYFRRNCDCPGRCLREKCPFPVEHVVHLLMVCASHCVYSMPYRRYILLSKLPFNLRWTPSEARSKLLLTNLHGRS